MTYILDNLLPILVATALGLAFGFVWYRTLGRSAATEPLTPRHAAVSLVAEFWLASILAGALILAPPEAGEWVMAVGTPIVIWIGFVVPALAVSIGHLRVPSGTVLREGGHWLGVMLIQAIALQLIGLAPPPA